MERAYKHPLRQFECRVCETHIELEMAMSAPAIFSKDLLCGNCHKMTTFDVIFSPTYITAGMYTKRYTGQTAAVKGWGTHNLDYGKAGSDLLAGRATEAAKANPGRVKS